MTNFENWQNKLILKDLYMPKLNVMVTLVVKFSNEGHKNQ